MLVHRQCIFVPKDLLWHGGFPFEPKQVILFSKETYFLKKGNQCDEDIIQLYYVLIREPQTQKLTMTSDATCVTSFWRQNYEPFLLIMLWAFWACPLRAGLFVIVFSQYWHVWLLPSKSFCMLPKKNFCVNAFPHCSQLDCFSIVWNTMCLSTSTLVVLDFPHSIHTQYTYLVNNNLQFVTALVKFLNSFKYWRRLGLPSQNHSSGTFFFMLSWTISCVVASSSLKNSSYSSSDWRTLGLYSHMAYQTAKMYKRRLDARIASQQ